MKFPRPVGNATTQESPNWLRVESCPLCGGLGRLIGPLRIDRYAGLPSIELQPAILLLKCTNCTLVYKDIVPSQKHLAEITAANQQHLWQDTYSYKRELEVLDRATDGATYDLLDIGPAGGGFLRAVGCRGGRLSALDIVKFDRLRLSNGEFIEGFLDDKNLQWSGDRYDVVTLFDVMEHLYAPSVAMRNLNSFCKPGGWILLETGNSDWAPQATLATWYYLANYQHHLVWNRQSLSHAAAVGGFEIVSLRYKRHKLNSARRGSLRNALGQALYHAAPETYLRLSRLCGYAGDVPANLRAADHMQVLLRMNDGLHVARSTSGDLPAEAACLPRTKRM